MMPAFMLVHILPAVFDLLPTRMASPAAQAMLLAIALQESRCKNRRQMPIGPARGFWQFEIAAVVGVRQHLATRDHYSAALVSLAYDSRTPTRDVLAALEHNDILAGVLARLLLWTLPGELPGRDGVEEGWRQYLEAWRPGRPRLETWEDSFGRAWMAVEPLKGDT